MEKILFIFEGEKTEENIFKSVFKIYSKTRSDEIIKVAYCRTIYDLYIKLKKDPDIDIIEILRENSKNESILSGITRDKISMTYLFFDYDGHAPIANDNNLNEMLELFDEETDKGKLYISYPMVEAYKNFTNKINFNCKEMCDVEAKINIKFKEKIAKNSVYNRCEQLSYIDWNFIITNHIKKSYCIINKNCEGNLNYIPSYKEVLKMTQKQIFEAQLNKFIIPQKKVAIISCIPQFIIEYFGEKLYNEIIEECNKNVEK